MSELHKILPVHIDDSCINICVTVLFDCNHCRSSYDIAKRWWCAVTIIILIPLNTHTHHLSSGIWQLQVQMSMSNLFFFRLHNLRRQEGHKKRGKRTGFQDCSNLLTLAPSRLYEKAPVTPTDSLDELASHIPRCLTAQWYPQLLPLRQFKVSHALKSAGVLSSCCSRVHHVRGCVHIFL